MTFVNNAAVYITSSEQGNSAFTHNLGSVIETYNTDLYMSGNVLFEYNKAEKGAAVETFRWFSTSSYIPICLLDFRTILLTHMEELFMA